MGVRTAGVGVHALLELDGQQFPLRIVDVVGQVDSVQGRLEVHPLPGVNPRPEPDGSRRVTLVSGRRPHTLDEVVFGGAH